jgi:hypothetical protein
MLMLKVTGLTPNVLYQGELLLMPLDTELLSKNPTIWLHRPSFSLSAPFPSLSEFHTGHELLAHRFSIPNKLGMNGMAFEALFFFFNGLLISCC